LFQYDQNVNEWLNDYDKSKIGKLKITKVNDLSLGDTYVLNRFQGLILAYSLRKP